MRRGGVKVSTPLKVVPEKFYPVSRMGGRGGGGGLFRTRNFPIL